MILVAMLLPNIAGSEMRYAGVENIHNAIDLFIRYRVYCYDCLARRGYDR